MIDKIVERLQEEVMPSGLHLRLADDDRTIGLEYSNGLPVGYHIHSRGSFYQVNKEVRGDDGNITAVVRGDGFRSLTDAVVRVLDQIEVI